MVPLYLDIETSVLAIEINCRDEGTGAVRKVMRKN
jgi:hypothetical protein